MKGPKFNMYRDAGSKLGVETFHIPDISIFGKTSTKSAININVYIKTNVSNPH